MPTYREIADHQFSGLFGGYLRNKDGDRALFWPLTHQEGETTKAQLKKLFEEDYEGTLLGRFPSGDIVGISEDGAMFSILHDCGEICPGAPSFDEFMDRVFWDESLENGFYLVEE